MHDPLGNAEPERRARRVIAATRRFCRDTRGATAIEYGLIAALVFAVAVSSIRAYGSKMDAMYGRIGNAIAQSN